MPAFKHYLMVLGSICDTECSVHLWKCTVKIYDPKGLPLLQGWQDNKGSKIWRFVLQPQSYTPYSTEEDGQAFNVIPKSGVKSSDLPAFSAYDLPIVEAVLHYFHATVGFPVKSTWLDAIKYGNFSSWPDLNYQNAAK